MKNLAFLFIFIFLLNLSASAQTTIPGGEVSGVWTKDNSPYLISGDITITGENTLEIEPGVKIEFQDNFGLFVEGNLLAQGTEKDSIIFTVSDTTGFTDPTITRGGWYGIRIMNQDPANDSTKISFCRLEFGKTRGDSWHENSGGAILAYYSPKVRISDCLFNNNMAMSGESPAGGAISCFWSDIIIRNCIFFKNQSFSGGALYLNESDPLIENSIIMDNKADLGGGINIGMNSVPSINNCRIITNHATENGGGIKINPEGLNLVFENVIFEENSAGYGGAIEAADSKLILINCTFDANSVSGVGAGIRSFESVLDITGCRFENGSAEIFGGAISTNESIINISSSTFTDNNAVVLGGAIHSDYFDLRLDSCFFENNGAGENGGAVFTWQSESMIDFCNFSENSASFYGGAYYGDSTGTVITNTNFSNNHSEWGGGAQVDRSSVNISNCNFGNNSGRNGGALSSNFCLMSISYTDFISNRSQFGGGIRTFNTGLNMDSCTFNRNEAESDGGALLLIADTVNSPEPFEINIENSDFTYNNANRRCGVMFINQMNSQEIISGVKIDNCSFISNTSPRIAVNRFDNILDFTISNTIFKNNTAELTTANSTFGMSKGRIYNCLIDNNTAGTGTSGGISAANWSTLEVTNCTIVNNSAASGGSGINLRQGAKIYAINNIIWNNDPDPILLTAVSDTAKCVFYIDYNDFEGDIHTVVKNDEISEVHWGFGNINLDPHFKNKEESDYRLSDNSFCIGAGVAVMEMDDDNIYIPDRDILGNDRPLPEGTLPDQGAYESELGSPGTYVEQSNQELFDLRLHPNPFTSFVSISYELSSPEYVSMKIYDFFGNELSILVNGPEDSGNHEIEFEGSDLPSGIYLLTLCAGGKKQIEKLVLIR